MMNDLYGLMKVNGKSLAILLALIFTIAFVATSFFNILVASIMLMATFIVLIFGVFLYCVDDKES